MSCSALYEQRGLHCTHKSSADGHMEESTNEKHTMDSMIVSLKLPVWPFLIK